MIYWIDIIYFITGLCVIKYIRKLDYSGFNKSDYLYLIFLGWLIFEVIRGFTLHGFRSLGESRYIASLYMCFIPMTLIEKGKDFNNENIYKVLENTIYISGIAGFLVFIIEYVNGGRYFIAQLNTELLSGLEDARGIRYLDVYHVFNILILAVYLILRMDYKGKINIWDTILAMMLIIAALVSQGRTSIISIGISFLILLSLKSSMKALIKTIVFIGIVICIFKILFPGVSEMLFMISSDILTFFKPQNDITGTVFWRWAVNIAAYEQAFQTFWLGQAYGGYFSFDVPLISSEPITFPPHNMYIIIFLKAGIIGIILMLASLCVIVFNLFKSYKIIEHNKSFNLYLSLIIVVIISQIPFGFAYNFVQSFGLYYGFSVILVKSIPQHLKHATSITT
jgi:O-antigen ligase